MIVGKARRTMRMAKKRMVVVVVVVKAAVKVETRAVF